MKIWKYAIMKRWKYKNIQIWKYTNIHVEKCKCEKCKRICKQSKYIYMKNYKVTSNRNVNKETNKQNKERIYKNSKDIEMCINIYKIYIQTWKYANI